MKGITVKSVFMTLLCVLVFSGGFVSSPIAQSEDPVGAAVSGTVQALFPTAMASASLPPAASAVPTAREIPDPVGCEDAKLVSHVPIPDGTTLLPAQPFNWSENDVDLVYSSGEAPIAETRLDLPGNVPPGGTITFPKIDFNSGRTPGNSIWTLYNNAEAICSFGI